MNIDSERIVVSARDQLSLQAWRAPAPAAGQVRVRVMHSAVSFGDVMLRRRVFRKRPAVSVPGYEVVGEIDEVGAGVADFRPGQRVAAFVEYGGNARHAIVPAADCVSLPSGVDPAIAAASVLNYATAFMLIEAAGLVQGDAFVVQGATGGVGSALLDVGRALGLRAIGTARSGRASLLGAPILAAGAPTLADDVAALAPAGLRAVFDGRAGRSLWRSRGLLRRRDGVLIVFGLSSVAQRGLAGLLGAIGTLASLALFNRLIGPRNEIVAIDRIFNTEPSRVRAWVERTLAMLATGALSPVIGVRLPLAETAQAHHLLETGQVVGKIVLDA